MTEKDSLLDTKIGGCLLLEKIGQGGMGTVYMARQLSLDRVVALKILSPIFAKDKEKRERFLKEAKSSAKLHHPNIISIHSAGFDGGHCYYAMEYIEGGSVKDIITKNGKIPEDRALEIIYEIAQGLQHAFQKKLIHRDVKPDNFMLTKEGGVKLCDLGLAKILEDDPHLTQEGVFMGTPYYTSPEQAKGNSEVDIRSDLYSLGASLFHMVSGRHPFEGSNPISVITMHINDPAPLVSKYLPSASKGIVHLIDKLLKKDPKDRYQTPLELMEAISEIFKKHHKKNKTLRISQQMPAFEKDEESAGLNFIKPILITLAVVLIAYFGFSFIKPKGKKIDQPSEVALNSGLRTSFNADKQKFLITLAKTEVSSAVKREKFKEIYDIYAKALPSEVSALGVEMGDILNAMGLKLANAFYEKMVAESDKYFLENKFGNAFKSILAINESKLNIGLDDLNNESRTAFLDKVKQARKNFLNKLLDNATPIKNNEENLQIVEVRDLLHKQKEFEEILFAINKAIMEYFQKAKGKVKDTPPIDKSEEKKPEIVAGHLSKELLDIANTMRQNIAEKKLVELVRTYIRNRDKIKIDDNEKLIAAEFPETICAAESVERLYSDFSRNMRRLMEGESFELANVKYVIVRVTADSIGLMDEKKEFKEVPFDKLPIQLLQNYTVSLRDFDQGLKLSLGVYDLLSGEKAKGNEIIKSIDDATKSRFLTGLAILQK